MNSCRINPLELNDLKSAFSLLSELRPHINENEFKRIYQAAESADRYRFIGAWAKGVLVGLIGVRELHDYVHGTHWYVDDLVVSSEFRSQGIGSRLLSWLEDEAVKCSISCLRLSTGTQNTSAMRFYEREGWEMRSVTYKKFLRGRSV